MKVADLEKVLGYNFNDKKLLEEALTHPSKKVEDKKIKSYQRLEFIGDKVLNFIIAAELFSIFPHEQEGDISKRHANLVAGFVCNKIAVSIGVPQYIIFSKAQLNDSTYRPEKVAEDAMEAIIGAIFIDGGINNVREFVLKHWRSYIRNDVSPPKDAKSALQEYFQKRFKSLPVYQITQEGEQFTAAITIDGKSFSATARTKKEAEKKVADAAVAFYF